MPWSTIESIYIIKLLSTLSPDLKSDPTFRKCYDLTMALPNEVSNSEKKAVQQATLDKYKHFLMQYKKGFEAESGFKRWKTLLVSFILGSSNTTAVKMFADHIVRLKNSSNNLLSHQNNDNLGVSRRGIHDEFEYSEWKIFLEKECDINLNDQLIQKHTEAIIEISNEKYYMTTKNINLRK